MASSSSFSSQPMDRSFNPLLSIEPSSDAFLDSDFQSSDVITRRPPVTLRRVGPQRRKNWILYEPEQEREFLEWWEKTEYGRKLNSNGQCQIKWSTDSRHAEVWKHFDQVAILILGAQGSSAKPVLLCLITHNTKIMGQAR